MESRCEKCNGPLIEGALAGMSGICFYPEGEVGKMRPRRSLVVCYCCKDCGAIQGLKVKNPAELNVE